jgi:hypothetical protein
LPPASCSQGSAVVLQHAGRTARVVQGFECDSTRERARLVAWSITDGERVWNAPADAGTLAFARKLVALSDVDGDGWQDFAAISLDAATQTQMVSVRSGASGESLHVLRGEADERDFASVVLALNDRNGDGIADWAVGACVKHPVERAHYAALVLVSGNSGERLDRIVSSERVSSTQGFAHGDGGDHVRLLAGKAVLDFDLAAGVVAHVWQSRSAAATPLRLVRGCDGSPCVLESLAGGELCMRALDATTLADRGVRELPGLRPLVDLVRVPDRNGDGCEDFLALHTGSAAGLATWLSGRDFAVLGALRPDGVPTQFQSREAHSLGELGFLITNGNQRPLEKDRGVYWFGADGKLRRVFAGS